MQCGAPYRLPPQALGLGGLCPADYRLWWSPRLTQPSQGRGPGGGTTVPVASALSAALSDSGMQAPWPRVRASRGRGSPGRARQLSPLAQRAVATPQAAPRGRAHIGQQPQPAGRAGSGQEVGRGGQSASLSAEQGAQCHGWGAPTAAPSWTANRRRSGQARTAGSSGIIRQGGGQGPVLAAGWEQAARWAPCVPYEGHGLGHLSPEVND